jgi:hypothetical protein
LNYCHGTDISNILQDDLYTAQPKEFRILTDEHKFPIMVDNVGSYGKEESKLDVNSQPASPPVTQEDRLKVSRYRTLLLESKRFVDGICKEYCNQNAERLKHLNIEISYAVD